MMHSESRPTDLATLLIVDDDDVLRDRLARAFQSRGYDVRVAADCESALASARHDSPEWAVIDLRMPGRSGLELLQELKQIDPGTSVLILSGYGSIATAVAAMRLGALTFLPKPVDADDIIAAFRPADAAHKAQEEFQPPTLARAEWEHICRVLSDCAGNISHASRRLGLHRRSLQRKLQKYPPTR